MPTFTKKIATGTDDCYSSSGTFQAGLDYMLMGKGAPVLFYGGLRFTGVTIPKGATISSAKITFRAETAAITACELKIYGVDEDNFNGFTSTAGDSPDDYSGALTTATVNWTPGNWTKDSDYDTADIKTVIQEIVDRASWASGNALGLIIADNGSASGAVRRPYTYEATTDNCAILTVEYTSGSFIPQITFI